MAAHNTIHSTSGCFQGLSQDTLDFLDDHKTQIEYFKGEMIVKQGAFAPHVLFVNAGLVKVYIQTGSLKQVGVSIAKQGDFMAFNSIFGDAVYHYSAVALQDSTICMIDKEALKKVLLDNPLFALQITSRNSQSQIRYLEIIHNISYKQMRGKLASALLYLDDVIENGGVFPFLTRQDVADFASITIESAIKFLKEFEKEKLLELQGKHIFIQNKKEIQLISKNG